MEQKELKRLKRKELLELMLEPEKMVIGLS